MFSKKLLQEVLIILLIGISIAVVYNLFNPEGVSFIPRDKAELMVSDSILFADETQFQTDSSLIEAKAIEPQKIDTVKTDDKLAQAEEVKPETKIETEIETKHTKKDEFKLVTFEQMKRIISSPAFLIIDARTVADYEKAHIPNSINIYPYIDESELVPRLMTLPKDKTIVIYCDGGTCDLSHELAKIMIGSMGFTKIFLYEGGWEEWSRKFRN